MHSSEPPTTEPYGGWCERKALRKIDFPRAYLLDSGREGHRSIAQATRRIALQVEDKILDEFGSEFASAFSLTAIN